MTEKQYFVVTERRMCQQPHCSGMPNQVLHYKNSYLYAHEVPPAKHYNPFGPECSACGGIGYIEERVPLEQALKELGFVPALKVRED